MSQNASMFVGGVDGKRVTTKWKLGRKHRQQAAREMKHPAQKAIKIEMFYKSAFLRVSRVPQFDMRLNAFPSYILPSGVAER